MLEEDLRRVLIIDDSPEDREVMRVMLGKSYLRLHITEAETGEAGLRACFDSEEGPPDCIVLDYCLPDLDVSDLLTALGGPDSPCCPVVVATGHTDLPDSRTVLQLGAQDFIGKSWLNPQSLARAIENAIERFAMFQHLREREKVARQRAEEVEALMDSAPVAIFLSQDPECLEIQGNQLALRLYEAEPGQNLSAGSTHGEILDPVRRFFRNGSEVAPRDLPMQRAVRESRKVPDEEIEVILPSGRLVSLLCRASPLFDDNGQVRGSIGAFIDITDSKRAHQSLRAERDRFEKIDASVPGVIAAFRLRPDGSTCFPYASPSIQELYGLTHAQLVDSANPLWERIHPDDIAHLRATITLSAQALSPWRAEYRVLHPDRGEIWVEGHAKPETDIDGSILWYGYVHDITDRKHAEELLRASEAFNRSILNSSADCIKVIDLDGNLILMNEPGRCAMEIDDFSVVANQPWKSLCPESSRELVDSALQSARDGGVGRFQSFCPTAMGVPRWWDVIVTAVPDTAGRPARFVAISRDVTRQRQTEMALRNSEETMQMALEVSNSFAFEWKPASDRVIRTDGFAKVLGLSVEDAVESRGREFFQSIHPDDRTDFLSLLQGLQPQADTYHTEFRLIRADGTVVTLLESARGFFDAEGRLQRLVGATTDITEQKRTELVLRETQQRFNQMAASIGEVFWMSSPDGQTFLYLTPSAETILGIKLADLYANPGLWLQALEPEDVPRLLACHHEVLATGCLDIDYRIRRADGSLRWINDRGRACYNSDGEIIYVSGVASDITERKIMEQTLREREARFRALYESSGDAIGLFGPQGFLECNEATLRMVGCSTKEEFLGNEPWNFSPPTQPGGGDSRMMAHEHIAKAFAQGSHQFEWQHCRLDGTEFSAEIMMTRIDLQGQPVLQVIMRDITARKQMEQALRTSEARFHTLFDSSPDLLALIDDQKFLDCNKAGLRLFGCADRKDVIGRSPDQFSPPIQPNGKDSRALAQELLEATIKNGKHRFEWRHRRLDGTEFPAEVVLTAVELQGKPMVFATARDITERKTIQTALAEAKTIAEQANQAKSMFLANMSHEIRTPIHAVMGMTELCLGTELSPQQLTYVSTIKSASDALLHLINDILDFSRIEAGKLDLVNERFQLTGVLDDVVSLFASWVQEKGLDLVIRLKPNVAKKSFSGDPRRLRQVLINLVGNAIKFSTRGQVKVSVTEQPQGDGQSILRFAVSDEGIGMSREQQAELFQAFSQADASTTRTYGGSGLGLAISKRLIEMMGGQIGVASILGQGSTFQFTIRCTLPDPASEHLQDAELLVEDGAERHHALAQALPEQSGLQVRQVQVRRIPGLRVLVVDDSDINQEVVKGFLEAVGAVVTLANDGQDAVDWLQAHPGAVDIVLMDIQMPRLDGYRATRYLRADPHWRKVPIVALTAGVLESQRSAAYEAGMNDFLAKPFNADTMINVIQRWTGCQAEVVDGDPEALPPAIAASPENGLAVPSLPGIDGSGAFQQWGQIANYRTYLKKFADNYAKAGETIAVTCRQGDRLAAAALAHKLCGTAGTLRLPEVSRLAEELETRLQAGELPFETADKLQAAIDKVCASIVGWTEAANPPPNAQPSAGPHRDSALLVQDLLAALDRNDRPSAETALHQLQATLDDPRLAAIQACLTDFDFPGARVAAEPLWASLDL